ncbi:Nuclear cap-binding protein subunit 2 [Platanthera guangdongensis]|uniref:Nuclear cap-binding protein subunit 2 n=1 Tax=Platanthera guangdongensis TaxID=2320717 RepID=A0ABR2LL37_9ASPA
MPAVARSGGKLSITLAQSPSIMMPFASIIAGPDPAAQTNAPRWSRTVKPMPAALVASKAPSKLILIQSGGVGHQKIDNGLAGRLIPTASVPSRPLQVRFCILPRAANEGLIVLLWALEGIRQSAQSFSSAKDILWSRDLFADSLIASGLTRADGGTKLYISNLDYGVSNEDIKELFSEVGDLKRSTTHYDMNGRPSGSAEVVYTRRSDAIAAVKRYNNVQLDDAQLQFVIHDTIPLKVLSSTLSSEFIQTTTPSEVSAICFSLFFLDNADLPTSGLVCSSIVRKLFVIVFMKSEGSMDKGSSISLVYNSNSVFQIMRVINVKLSEKKILALGT